MSTQTPEITLDQLEAAMRDGAHLIDVREASEYAEAHVPDARPIPMSPTSVPPSPLPDQTT